MDLEAPVGVEEDGDGASISMGKVADTDIRGKVREGVVLKYYS